MVATETNPRRTHSRRASWRSPRNRHARGSLRRHKTARESHGLFVVHSSKCKTPPSADGRGGVAGITSRGSTDLERAYRQIPEAGGVCAVRACEAGQRGSTKTLLSPSGAADREFQLWYQRCNRFSALIGSDDSTREPSKRLAAAHRVSSSIQASNAPCCSEVIRRRWAFVVPSDAASPDITLRIWPKTRTWMNNACSKCIQLCIQRWYHYLTEPISITPSVLIWRQRARMVRAEE